MNGKVEGVPNAAECISRDVGEDPGNTVALAVAEAAADAARQEFRRLRPGSGGNGAYAVAKALWLAMNILLGAESARTFIVFLATEFLDDHAAGRKGVM